MISLRQLINAKAVIKQLNFRKAAKVQNISQPALSRSITSLEDSLGVKLFNRNPSGISLTVYGETLDKHSEQVLIAINELEREIKIIKEGGLGELSVAVGPYPAELSGHKAVGKLISVSPDIRCNVIVSGWKEVEKLVLNREVDLGLAELGKAVENTYLTTEPLVKHQVTVFCRSGHPIFKKSRISKTDLDCYPLVMTEVPPRVISQLPGKFFRSKDSKQAFPSIQIEDLSLSRQIVKECDAIGIATPLQIEDELKTGVFTIIPYQAEQLCTNYGFLYHKDRALSPAAIRYMSIVKEIEKDVEIRNKELVKKYCNID